MTAPHEQKLRITGPVVVTANRVGDGAVVYRTADGGWSTRLADASVLTEANRAREALAAANADEHAVAGAYIASVALDPDGLPVPINLREFIRRDGPTIALPQGKAA